MAASDDRFKPGDGPRIRCQGCGLIFPIALLRCPDCHWPLPPISPREPTGPQDGPADRV